MDKITLQGEPRSAGRHPVRELRGAGRVPAILYGSGMAPQPIAVDAKLLRRALHDAGSGLLTLQIGNEAPIQVLAREVQHDPVKHNALHVDFQAVSLTERLRLHVPIVHEGTAPAMSNQDIVLVRNMDAIEIECLPTDIPNHLVADISTLRTLEDEILAKDLHLPAGVKLMADPEHPVFSLTLARAAAEEEAEAVEAPAEVEVVVKGKAKEGAEVAEE
jgi:large subunit ribosomal protein L25